MKKLLLLLALFILSACTPLDPVEVDGEMVRYCNDPLLEEGEDCITDDRGTLLGVVVGSIVFLSSIAGTGYLVKTKSLKK